MKIIYIASDVRSGSTMLDYLLGNHPDAVGVGEIRYLYTHIIREGKGDKHGWACSCGEAIETCSFWKPVLERAQEKGGNPWNDDTGYVLKSGRKLKNLLTLSALIFPFPVYQRWLVKRTQLDLQSQKNLAHCARYMEGIEQIYNKVIIDSSKKGKQLVNLLKALETYPDSELKVIHLIRDPRATTWSKVKRQGLKHSPWNFFRSMVSWVTENAEIRLAKAIFPEQHWLTVRYEDLCKDLDGTLSRIWTQYQLNSERPGLGELNKEEKHNICGSPTRFEKNRTQVQLECNWLKEFRYFHHLIYRVIAWPFLKVLGYGRKEYYK